MVCGYRLNEKLPNHSSLTRIRQRWGEQRFKKIFQKTVETCIKHGLVDGETIHIDATLIRANVSWKSICEQHMDKVLEENTDENDKDNSNDGQKIKSRSGNVKKKSKTDPDASFATGNSSFRMEPSYNKITIDLI